MTLNNFAPVDRSRSELLSGAGGTPALSGAALLSKVGHELRSSLTGIVGLARMLLLRLDSPPVDEVTQRRQLTMVRDGAEATLHTVERVIELARIAIGQTAVVPVPVDCHRAATAVIEALQPAATARGVRLNARPAVGSPIAMTDERLLGRIMHELLDNAIRFTDGDAVRVEIAGTGAGTMISISDDGPGIDATERAQIFEPFTRGAAAMHRDEAGAGLGLYLARRLAQLLGAEVAVTDSSGRGSTFTVRIPIGRAATLDRTESESRS